MGDERYFDVLNRSITFQMGRSIDLWGDYYDIALDSNGHRPGGSVSMAGPLDSNSSNQVVPTEDNNQDFSLPQILQTYGPISATVPHPVEITKGIHLEECRSDSSILSVEGVPEVPEGRQLVCGSIYIWTTNGAIVWKLVLETSVNSRSPVQLPFPVISAREQLPRRRNLQGCLGFPCSPATKTEPPLLSPCRRGKWYIRATLLDSSGWFTRPDNQLCDGCYHQLEQKGLDLRIIPCSTIGRVLNGYPQLQQLIPDVIGFCPVLGRSGSIPFFDQCLYFVHNAGDFFESLSAILFAKKSESGMIPSTFPANSRAILHKSWRVIHRRPNSRD